MPMRASSGVEPRFRRDFWKFWTGQTISTLGSSFTSFAFPLLIFKLTGSSLNLALTVVATVLPYLLFGLVIGAWVDRANRKRLMVVTDLARALVIASIPLASVEGLLSVWWIYAVAFLNSALTICFDAASFLVSAGSLVLITTSFNTAPDERQAPTSLRQDIVEGLRYVLKHPILSWIALLLLLVNFILPTSSAQLVLFAKQWFAASNTHVC